MAKAMVVLSGGQDSTTTLYWAREHFAEVHAVTFDYGQKHARELEAAKMIARMADVETHEVVKVGPILAGRSPLTNPGERLETYTSFDEMDAIIGDRVELTFVPMRNAFFLTLAANRAVCQDIFTLVTGVCEADNANYPDCRRVFIDAQERAITTALGLDKRGQAFMIETPLMSLSKADTVKLAMSLPGCYEALAYSHTAYSGEFPPVTQDHATVLRAHGFRTAGVPDPIIARAFYELQFPLPNEDHYAPVKAAHSVSELARNIGAAV
jgi:7-cyano-7-deazaguanine synthase